MKQTAVEWLINQFNEERHLTEDEFNHLIKKSKEMEKQQIVDAWECGYEEGAGVNDFSIYHGNVYYNNTFKKEKDESN